MTTGPYARLYLSLVDDPKFAVIYDDDRHFATWCRLLMIAEPAWPASAHLPATADPVSVRTLAEVGLIDLQQAGRYRIHGLDSERERRSKRASAASNARWNATASAPAIPYRAEPSTTEPSRERATDADEDGRADLDAWLMVRRRPPTERQRAFLDSYVRTFDVTGPARAERLILGHPDDPIAALKADLDEFRKERLAALPPEPVRPVRPTRLPGVSAELADFLRSKEATA